MPVWCREAEVIECSVHGGDGEEGDVLLAVALCSPATTLGEGELGCCHSTLTLSKSVSDEIQDRKRDKKQQFFFSSFLQLQNRTDLRVCCVWTIWTSTFSRTGFTSPRSTVLNRGHSHSSLSSKSGRLPRVQMFTMRHPLLTPE